MSDSVHLLIPFAACDAACSSEAPPDALAGLALPHLERLLARLAPAGTDEGTVDTLSPPHERALAAAHGLPVQDGLIPWAAWQAQRQGLAIGGKSWAHITPCHWTVATDHIAMRLPEDLALDTAQSHVVFEAMRPWFEEDGITLLHDTPAQWLAHGPVFDGLATASADRVSGRPVDPWLPRQGAARSLRRLQQEMQMLLYTHPVSDARLAAGRLPVNSFWVSGTGSLPGQARPRDIPADLRVADGLRVPALRQDAAAWAAAWRQIDDTECAALLAALEQGRPVALTLCGERHARRWQGAAGRWQRAAALWRRPRVTDLLKDL
jgi:hypothetical protein